MSLSLVSLKSFGDFVIAMHSIEKIIPSKRLDINIIAGIHLKPLAIELRPNNNLQFISSISGTDVPAAFDVGNRGKLAAIRSLFYLRQQIGRQSNSSQLIFDRIGCREKFIASGLKCLGLPTTSNIYMAYEYLFNSCGYVTNRPLVAASRPSIKSAVIFPSSRIKQKILPKNVIFNINAILSEYGIFTKIITLQGEEIATPNEIPTITIPKTFLALVTALSQADIVISADSLAAHLGEYYGRPTFVATPIANKYWLPPNAFATDAWACFTDLAPLSKWLQNS